MMAGERASAFEDDGEIDLTGFAPKTTRSDGGAPAESIKAIAEKTRFRERDVPAAPSVAAAGEGPRVPRRYRTGRNRQINIKASDETIRALYAIADAEGWVLGETLERALQALQRELDSRSA